MNKEKNKDKKEKIESKKKAFTPPPGNNSKPFSQFSTQPKFSSGPSRSYTAFHRRLGK